MPKAILNSLHARGPAIDIAAMVEQLSQPVREGRTDISFRNISVPESGDINHAWALEHWGCKWDAEEADFEDHSQEAASYHFSTVGTPPVQAIAELSRQYPRVKFILDWENEREGDGAVLHCSEGNTWVVQAYGIVSHADAQVFSTMGCKCVGFEDAADAVFSDCPIADPDDWFEDWTNWPRCDFCGALEALTPLFEWNGDTGCHVVCETATRRTVEYPDAFKQELTRMQFSTDPLVVITARLQTHAR